MIVDKSSNKTTGTPSKTTIQIDRATKEALAALGSKNSSYEEIIQELLKEWRKNH